MGALLPYVTIPFGFTNAQGGIFGVFFIICGIFSSGIFSGYLDRTAKYKKMFVILQWGGIISWGLVALVWYGMSDMSATPIKAPNFILACVAISLVGFFILPITPIGLSFLTEVTYPVSEVMTLGTASFFGQLLGIIVVTLVEAVNTDGKRIKAGGPGILAVVIGIGAVLSIFAKEDLRKPKSHKKV